MPEITSYEPGMPCWVDLGTPDTDAAVSFYGAVLGWDIPPAENAEQTGGYRIAQLQGKPAAGIMPLMQEGQPPAWTTYIAVADADATAAKAKDAGAQEVAAPMDVMDLGRMAVFVDPTGAFLGIWQAKSFPGAGIVNERGAISWNEANTRDPDRAKDFYGAVFGWEFRDFGDGGNYWTLHRSGDDHAVGGLMDMRGTVPDDVPPHWLVYFGIDDLDGAADRVKESGATVAAGPMDIADVGRFAVIVDQHGAAFGLFQAPGSEDGSGG